MQLLRFIEEKAHSLRKFKVCEITDWLGVTRATWDRWKRGSRMQTVTARKISKRIGLDRRALRKGLSCSMLSAGMVARITNETDKARSPSQLKAAVIRGCTELTLWLREREVYPTLLVPARGNPTITWSVEFVMAALPSLHFELEAEFTNEFWVVFSQRTGTVKDPLIEGPLSENLLMDMLRYISLSAKAALRHERKN